jgi:hypothetical protein
MYSKQQAKRRVLNGALKDVAVALALADRLRGAAGERAGQAFSVEMLSLARQLEHDAVSLREIVVDLSVSLQSPELMQSGSTTTAFSRISG